MTVVLSPEIHEAVEYFKKNLGYSDKHLYLGLVQFDVMKDKNSEFADVIYNFYKEKPESFIAAFKNGYVVERPIEFDQAIIRFFNGEELSVTHKNSGERHKVHKEMKKYPVGFELRTLDMWSWSEVAASNE
ncbi:hypothetical protein HKK70_08955 [Bacillus safensis]|uniref:hypothetical protein n=1 Tax=Bacillus safensis TaxID=561879 RepID=UPI00146D1C29|nr:hypothetical protein [Bacillus safensis]MCM3365979.1 hypothetical protein [Bacillus safensis]NMW01893.1 hypothetical protein [Bacillus safensis]